MQFLYSIVAQFYLNSGIPADQRIRHFDYLPRAFCAHINDILQVYIINHITATPAQGQAAISTSDCHFLILELGLIIPKEVKAGGHSINFREVCGKSDRLDIVAPLDKTSSIKAKTTLIEDGPIMVSALA